jgi:acetyl esterase
VIVYLPGAAAGTDDQLVGELAVGAEAAVAVVEYDRYPVAIEQGYATARWLTREGGSWGLDPTRMAVAGDEQLASVLRGALNDA